MKRWLGIQNVEDETTPPDTLTDAGLSLERPRIEVVNTKGQERITRNGPPPGMFVVNYETGRLNQWVDDHWEVVAEHSIGQPPYSLDDDGRPNAVGYRNALFGAMGAVGGGGATPAPRRLPGSIYPGFPGDPSVTQPLPPAALSLLSLDDAGTASTTPVNMVAPQTDLLATINVTDDFIGYGTLVLPIEIISSTETHLNVKQNGTIVGGFIMHAATITQGCLTVGPVGNPVGTDIQMDLTAGDVIDIEIICSAGTTDYTFWPGVWLNLFGE